MGPVLIERWLQGLTAIPILDEASVSLVRVSVRDQGSAAGLSDDRIEALATAASELVQNQLRHARRGQVAVRAIQRAGVPGLEVVAADEGQGIRDPERAFEEAPRQGSGSLGAGLAGAYRLADEVDFDVRLGEGTCIRARKFSAPLKRREVAIVGRPHPAETISGDDAAATWSGDTLVLAVADGLGHGEPAREAAARAITLFLGNAGQAPDDIVRLCDAGLKGTRGSALSVVRLEPGKATHAGTGNVSVQVSERRPGAVTRLAGRPGYLGDSRGNPRIIRETVPFSERSMLTLFTDGLSSKLDLTEEPDAFVAPPVVLAHRLLQRFGSSVDDALVIVVR